MAIPDFQSIFLPFLQILADGKEHGSDDLIDTLAHRFGLTPDERRILQPSGGQAVFTNRVAWATTYLTKAGLIERTGRKRLRITDRGRETVGQNLERIDTKYLYQFPEFVEFSRRSVSTELGAGSVGAGSVGEEAQATPDEMIQVSYQALRSALAQELLERVKRGSSVFFERIVIDLLVAMGYGGSLVDAAQAVGGTGDDGIDGIIKEDKLGLDFVYVQAKRWDTPVGRPIVQAFAGSLEGHRARKGVFITTSKFTRDAQEYVTRIEKRIVLVDGEQLAQLMIDHGVGVADVVVYHVKRVDADYFGAE